MVEQEMRSLKRLSEVECRFIYGRRTLPRSFGTVSGESCKSNGLMIFRFRLCWQKMGTECRPGPDISCESDFSSTNGEVNEGTATHGLQTPGDGQSSRSGP